MRSQRKMKWIWMVGVGSIVTLVLLVVIAPLVLRGAPKSPATEAVNNARQISIAMIEFENEYGSFPASSTIAAVRTATGTTLDFDTTTSNGYFRQMLGGGIAQSEIMFYAKNASSHKPDGIITGTHALEKGECGFTYFIGAISKTDNPNRPLVVAPMIPGTDRFDPKPFDGKAVFLQLDNSVSCYFIDKAGHVMIDGLNVMDPHHPIWDGHPPVIAWPDL